MGGQQRGKHTILGVSIKNSRSSIVAKFRAGFISHSGLKIEREISHIFEIRNFPQRNIPVAKISPLLYSGAQPMGWMALHPHHGCPVGSPGDERDPPTGIARGSPLHRAGLLTGRLPMATNDTRRPGIHRRWGPHRGRFRTARAQSAHSANYYGDYPGSNPENYPPAESCTINSRLKNSNI